MIKGAGKPVKKKNEPAPILEIGFSILSICLAMVLLGSPQLFDRAPNAYEFFKAIAPEYGWAILFISAAVVKVVGLATKKRIIRRTGLIGSTLIYGLIAAAYYLGSGWFSIGFFTYAVLSFMALSAVREVDVRDGE